MVCAGAATGGMHGSNGCPALESDDERRYLISVAAGGKPARMERTEALHQGRWRYLISTGAWGTQRSQQCQGILSDQAWWGAVPLVLTGLTWLRQAQRQHLQDTWDTPKNSPKNTPLKGMVTNSPGTSSSDQKNLDHTVTQQL